MPVLGGGTVSHERGTPVVRRKNIVLAGGLAENREDPPQVEQVNRIEDGPQPLLGSRGSFSKIMAPNPASTCLKMSTHLGPRFGALERADRERAMFFRSTNRGRKGRALV